MEEEEEEKRRKKKKEKEKRKGGTYSGSQFLGSRDKRIPSQTS